MNRALIITIGIVIIILILGVWVYLMLFGTPEKGGDVFTNLGFELSVQDTTIAPPVDSQPIETLVDTQSGAALRQLTTRPIAGFAFISASSSTYVRYVERGTGHMYQINLDTGVENILSRTTVPRVTKAIFSPNANTVALTSYDDYLSNVFVGTLDDDSNLIGIALQPGANNISFSSDEDVLYAISNKGDTQGYTHNIHTLVQSELFSIDYSNLDIAWGSDLEEMYLTTKPSKELEGFIYTTKDNVLTPTIFSAYGLSALFSNDYIIATHINGDIYTSIAVDTLESEYELPIIALKEKCVPDTIITGYLWCAAPFTDTTPSFVEDWYKGTVTSDDSLWHVDILGQTAQLSATPKNLIGRQIDVLSIKINTAGSNLSFINKIDHTLWLYDLVK